MVERVVVVQFPHDANNGPPPPPPPSDPPRQRERASAPDRERERSSAPRDDPPGPPQVNSGRSTPTIPGPPSAPRLVGVGLALERTSQVSFPTTTKSLLGRSIPHWARLCLY